MAIAIKNQYDVDFYAWTKYNATLLREGRLHEIDIEHIAEEIEDMGGNYKRSLISRLEVLLSHLLKWKFQPGLQGNSWKYTIDEQRFRISDLLEESPSLKYEIDHKLEHAYKYALRSAKKETGLDEGVFPQECPFSLEQLLDDEFFPGGPT